MRSLPQGLKGCFLPGTAKALMASPAAQALHKVLQLPKGSLGCETQQGLAQATSRSEPFHPLQQAHGTRTSSRRGKRASWKGRKYGSGGGP